MVKISIVILNWNRWVELNKCLQTVSKLSNVSYKLEIIVVDNASSDGSPDKIQNNYPKIILVKSVRNLGFSGGNNLGIKQALKNKSDFILILNNDTLLDEKLIEELFKTYNNYKINILSPKIYFSPGCEFHKDKYKPAELGKVIWSAGGIIDWNNVIGFHKGVDKVDQGQFDKFEIIDFATGAAMFIKSEVFKKVGLFDEKYFLYYEDLDFCMRAKLKGEKILFSPNAYLWHNNTGTGKSGSSLQDYYITRNRLLFGFRYAPIRSKISLIKESVRLKIKGRYWQRHGVWDFYLNKFEKGTYA